MCGICGAYAFDSTTGMEVPRLRVLRDLMTPRGPDGHGEWSSSDRRLWFGHRRLSIIDLSSHGAQPMTSADGRVTVTFNGEIYNFAELRRGLEARGHIFRSNSDTEVLIEQYRAKGPDFLRDLRGMFAFALWDESQGRLLLARDPYGIKPLYYADVGGMIVFASSVKALAGSGVVTASVDSAGLAGFYLFGSIPEPWTLYREIRAVPAGAMIEINRGGRKAPIHYHSITKTFAESEACAMRPSGVSDSDSAELAAKARAALLDSVRHHLVADVPVGAFLSAGVDSGALVGLMRDAGQEEIRTITLSYEEFAGTPSDEAPLAEYVARYYGTSHTTRRVSATELAEDLPRIMAAMDQPSIDGVNTWFVAKAAHEAGLKVAISGAGGDELLGGYDTFSRVPKIVDLLSLPTRVAPLAGMMKYFVAAGRRIGLPLNAKLAGALKYGGALPSAYLLQRSLFLPEEITAILEEPSFLREGISELDPVGLVNRALVSGPKGRFGQIAVLESTFYLRNQLLRDTDWASMAHSLEVRTPLVDHVLLAALAPIVIGAEAPIGKQVLANAPSKPLPEAILRRKKTGFGIPLERWLEQAGATEDKGEAFSRRWARRVALAQTQQQETPVLT